MRSELWKIVTIGNFISLISIILNSLLTKERPAMEINMMKHEWHDYPEEIKQFTNVFGKKAIFPVHGMLQLKRRTPEVVQRLLKHCAELYTM